MGQKNMNATDTLAKVKKELNDRLDKIQAERRLASLGDRPQSIGSERMVLERALTDVLSLIENAEEAAPPPAPSRDQVDVATLQQWRAGTMEHGVLSYDCTMAAIDTAIRNYELLLAAARTREALDDELAIAQRAIGRYSLKAEAAERNGQELFKKNLRLIGIIAGDGAVKVRHTKTSGLYLRSALKVVDATNAHDGRQMVLYFPLYTSRRADGTGYVPDAFVRDREEFESPGRFEVVPVEQPTDV